MSLVSYFHVVRLRRKERMNEMNKEERRAANAIELPLQAGDYYLLGSSDSYTIMIVDHPLSRDTADMVDIADSMADMDMGMDMGMGNTVDSTVASLHRITMEPLPMAANC
ncbi:hypothetical protein LJR153_005507 [Paenibacillus sp. LjRoot153]|uniref:hypothetical protein n=1 Tax=Paenibacillus sp. LjRoot153 TaxID=3342270 RepID=UPI003ECC3D53